MKPGLSHGPKHLGNAGCITSEFWEHHDADLRRLSLEGKTTTQAAIELGVSK